MELIILPDGTMGVYHWDIDPAPHIWDNFNPSSLLPTSQPSSSRQSEEKKQKGSASVAPPSVAPFVVSTERTWLARFEATERAFRINQARKAAFTPPPSPAPPAPAPRDSSAQ